MSTRRTYYPELDGVRAIAALITFRQIGVDLFFITGIFSAALVSWFGFESYFLVLKDRWSPESYPAPLAPINL